MDFWLELVCRANIWCNLHCAPSWIRIRAPGGPRTEPEPPTFMFLFDFLEVGGLGGASFNHTEGTFPVIYGAWSGLRIGTKREFGLPALLPLVLVILAQTKSNVVWPHGQVVRPIQQLMLLSIGSHQWTNDASAKPPVFFGRAIHLARRSSRRAGGVVGERERKTGPPKPPF